MSNFLKAVRSGLWGGDTWLLWDILFPAKWVQFYSGGDNSSNILEAESGFISSAVLRQKAY